MIHYTKSRRVLFYFTQEYKIGLPPPRAQTIKGHSNVQFRNASQLQTARHSFGLSYTGKG